jgi:hypothetical protein
MEKAWRTRLFPNENVDRPWMDLEKHGRLDVTGGTGQNTRQNSENFTEFHRKLFRIG